MVFPFFDIIQNYSEEDIIKLINNAMELLKKEKNLVVVPKGKTMIVGDLHGDIDTLFNIISAFFREHYKTLVFLGDYVDRGAKQVEVINVLFYYKKLMPDRITLIRGNHEDPFINRQYGFYDEIKLKFQNNKLIYRLYNQAFSHLPLAAITWNNVLCVHGGIPEGLEEIDNINLLPKCQEKVEDPITKQLLWNDPKEHIKDFKQSARGPGIKRFGKEAFDAFIERNELRNIVRSHEQFKNGFKTYFNDKLLSIFSSKSTSKRTSTVIGVIDVNGEIGVLPI